VKAVGEKMLRKLGVEIVTRLMTELESTFDELATWSRRE
jgi:hypothetical protein